MDASSAPDMDREKQPAVVDVDKQPAAVDRDNENVRTEKRILWTTKEDERLMSAWIKHSTDSTTGADRKGEAYWGDVIDEYNKKTAPQRARNAKQAKDRWHKINKLCDLFECAYLKARRVYTSGYSDQMWMEAAEDFYVEDSKNDEGKPMLGPFTLKNVWKMCREEPKWKTYNEGLKNARKRKSYHLEEEGEVNEDSADETPKRPIGQKAAKKVALAAKGKSKEVNEDGKSKNSAIDVDKVDRLGKIQECANADRMKILELQKKLSSDKIETTKIAHLTAQENRESKKLEMEGKKLEMEAKKIEMEGKKLEKE
nr:glutathione S-transferase T3-like [Setaria viridis]